MSFGLPHAIDDQGDRIVLQTPASWWRRRGLVLGVAVPGLLVVLVGLFGLLDLLQEAGGLLVGVAAGVCALVLVPSVLVGAVQLATASRNSARTRVEIDLQQREITTANEERVALDTVRSLALVKSNPLLKWMSIVAVTGGGPEAESPYRPPREQQVVLLGNLNELEVGKARVAMAELADRLGVSHSDRSPVLLGGGGRSGAGKGTLVHGLAYLPVQGIFLFASLFLLIARRDDAVARFHARQSLAFFAVELVVIVGGVIASLPLWFGASLLEDQMDDPYLPVAILTGLVLLVVTFARLGLRLYAGWRATQGEAWVIPGVGWLSRRWLPASSD